MSFLVLKTRAVVLLVFISTPYALDIRKGHISLVANAPSVCPSKGYVVLRMRQRVGDTIWLSVALPHLLQPIIAGLREKQPRRALFFDFFCGLLCRLVRLQVEFFPDRLKSSPYLVLHLPYSLLGGNPHVRGNGFPWQT